MPAAGRLPLFEGRIASEQPDRSRRRGIIEIEPRSGDSDIGKSDFVGLDNYRPNYNGADVEEGPHGAFRGCTVPTVSSPGRLQDTALFGMHCNIRRHDGSARYGASLQC